MCASAFPLSIWFFSRSISSSSPRYSRVLQKAHRVSSKLLPSICALLVITYQQPLQMKFPQHDLKLSCWPSTGRGIIHMGQSFRGGGTWNNLSWNNSAARFLQAFLCWGRWAAWQLRLQYFTRKHAPHALRLQLSSSPLPQLEQIPEALLIFSQVITVKKC